MTQTKTAAVAQHLRDQVLSGRYRAGDRIPSERELVDRLGIHRGAVREGLRSVEQLGLIEIKAGGPRVLPIQDASLDIVGQGQKEARRQDEEGAEEGNGHGEPEKPPSPFAGQLPGFSPQRRRRGFLRGKEDESVAAKNL